MKNCLCLVTIVSLFAIFLARSAQAADTKDEILNIIRERKQAVDQGDKKKWMANISENCLWVGENVASTNDVLDSFIAPSSDFHVTHDISDAEIRQHGDVVVVTYKQTDTAVQQGKTDTVSYRYLDTYIRHNNSWTLVAASETFVPPEPVRATVSSDVLRLYTGEYKLSPSVSLVVTLEGDLLMAQAPGQPKGELIPENETTFFSTGDPGRYIFVKNDKGAVDLLIYRSKGVALNMRRIK